jgi:hypothetical protein
VKPVFIILILFNIVVLLKAQDKSFVATEENLMNISRQAGTVFTTNMDKLYEGVRGTPYLFDEWNPGNIYLTDSTYIKNVNIKYNIYTDDLLYLNSTSGDSLIINRSMIWKFEIIDKPPDDIILMKEMDFKPGKTAKKVFVRVIYDGKSKLVLKYNKTFIKANYKGAYATGNKYDEYIDDYQYYIIKSSNNPVKIKLNKKSVVKALSDKEDKVKAYLDGHSLKLNNEDDIAELIKFYDSITD